MDEFDYKKALQDHFGDGLAVVVGSGLSCAEGLAGMAELTDHLNANVKANLDQDTKSEWSTLSTLIAARGLEPALFEFEPSEPLEAAIRRAIVNCLAPQERAAISEVIAGARTLRFTKLVPHLLNVTSGLPILTTNYDRLVEVACEAAGLQVDTMFDGSVLGRLDASNSRQSLLRTTEIISGKLRKEYRKHARVFKPHGSLDWYHSPDGPVRFSGDLELRRMIITPGKRKFRDGYDRPFSDHREKMNGLLDRAARLLIVGYGFNDDHLETHLNSLIRKGKPTLILTRGLSQTARSLAINNTAVIALERETGEKTRMIFQGKTFSINKPELWDLGAFVEEVFTL